MIKTKIELKCVLIWLFRWSLHSECDQAGKTNENCDIFSAEIFHRKVEETWGKDRFLD